MTPAELLLRARRSVASARLLFDTADRTGACNRAYYAMFDAARAALVAGVAGVEPLKSESIKTHNGLVTAFSLHLIKPGLISAHYAKLFGRVDQIRLAADYLAEDIDDDKSAWAVDQAHLFVEAIAAYLDGLGSASR